MHVIFPARGELTIHAMKTGENGFDEFPLIADDIFTKESVRHLFNCDALVNWKDRTDVRRIVQIKYLHNGYIGRPFESDGRLIHCSHIKVQISEMVEKLVTGSPRSYTRPSTTDQ